MKSDYRLPTSFIYNFLTSLLVLCVLLAGCQKDDITITDKDQNVRFEIKKVTVKHDEFLKKSFAGKPLNDLMIKSGVKPLEIHSDTRATVVEYDGVSYYTIPVITEETSSNSFSNLVLQIENDSIIQAYRYDYITDEEYVNNYDIAHTKDFEGKVRRISLNPEDYNFSKTVVCSTSSVLYCSYNYPHPAGEACIALRDPDELFMNSFTTCESYNDYESTPEEISAGDSGRSGGGGDSIITSPVPTKPCENSTDRGFTTGGGECIDMELYIEQLQAIESFHTQLTLEERIWLESYRNVEFRVEVEEYIKQNLQKLSAVAFAKEAIKAKKEDSRNEVDFEKELIKTKPFLDEPCLAGILDKLDYSSIAQGYLNNFTGEDPVSQLMFHAKPFDADDNRNAFTSPPENGVITITFNTNRLNRSRADIARTFVHEIIHAELFRKILIIAQSGSSSSFTEQDVLANKDSFPHIYEYYTRYVIGNPHPPNPQHELMAAYMRDSIEAALLEFDPTITIEEAEALAWIGLMKGVNGDEDSEIDPSSGLVVDDITGQNESTVAWTNTPQIERMIIHQTYNLFELNNPPCEQ